jgi:hypothetical protein
MVVKCIAMLAYVCSWAVIGIGVFHGMPVGVWFLASVLVFLGAVAAWNSLPQPASRPSLVCCGNCGSHGVKAVRDCNGVFPTLLNEKTKAP